MVMLGNAPRVDHEPAFTAPAKGANPSPALEAPSTNRRTKLLLVVLLVVVAAVGASRLLGGGGGTSEPATTPESSPVTPTTVSPAAGAVPQDQLAAEITTISTFVEKERGLAFKSPVKATVLDNAAFRERMNATVDEKVDEASLKQDEMILKAFGLASPDLDLVRLYREEEADEMVLGFYDPDTKELVVRGASITPLVRRVLAHELTHALDDQHFGLEEVEPGFDEKWSERPDAFRALIEGNAERIEEAYSQSMSPEDRAAADREEEAVGSADEGGYDPGEQPFFAFFGFPYAFGPDFVGELLEHGGQERLDAAFREPPRTTAEIMEPDRFLLGLDGAEITYPKAEGAIIDKGEIGELPLFLLVDHALGEDVGGLGAIGWEGGRFVAWRDGERMCIRARFLLESPETMLFTTGALAMWAERQVDASVEAPGTVLLSSCR